MDLKAIRGTGGQVKDIRPYQILEFVNGTVTPDPDEPQVGRVTILSNSSDGFNVKDYGAIGNGVVDDTISINLTIAACASAGGGWVFFPQGSYRFTSTITTPAGVSLRGVGTIGNPGAIAASRLIKDGHFDGIILGDSSGIQMLQLDGAIDGFGVPTNTGDGLYIIHPRCWAEHFAITNQGGDAWRIGGKVDGFNANVMRAYDIRAYKNLGKALYIHDAGATIDANSLSLFGFDFRLNGDGIVVERSIDCELYALFGVQNNGYGIHLLNGCKGVYAPHPYLEENVTADVLIDTGVQKSTVGPPRSFNTGSDWASNADDSVELIDIPNSIARFLRNVLAVDKLDVKNPDPTVGGSYWRFRQSVLTPRALEILFSGSATNNVDLRVGHASYFDPIAPDPTKLIDMLLAGTLTVVDRVALLASIGLANGSNFELSNTTGTMIGINTTGKLAFHGVTPVIQRAGANQAVVATTAATQTTPYGFTTQAQADGIVTLLNELRNALVEKGIIRGTAFIPPVGGGLLLETGDFLLLETGDHLLLDP